MHQNHDLSLRLLTYAAELLEGSHRQRGVCNFGAAQFAGNAARLFKFDDLSLRFATLLAAVTPDQFWSGMITNIPRTADVPRGACKLSTVAEIERHHPWFSEDPRTMIMKTERHLLPCLDHDYDAAFALADSELSKEEIALTQAVLGDTELAIQSTERLSQQHRRDHVLFVTTIELYRRNRLTEAEPLHGCLPKETLCEWGSAYMALGVSNRVPWIGYPYPDY